MACSCNGKCSKCKKRGGRIGKYQSGGYLQGPSHAQGGIPAMVGGTTPVELEGGEYWPVINEGPRTIRTVTGKDVQTLIDRNLNFELLNKDGSSLTTAQIEELMEGTSTQPVYIKNVHTGTADEAGLFGEEDYSGINFLTDADIAGLLGPIPGAATKHGQGLAARIEERERAEEEKVASAGAQTTKTSARPRRRRR